MNTKTKIAKETRFFNTTAIGILILTIVNSAPIYACNNQYASNQTDQLAGCTLSEEEEQTEGTLGGGGCIFYRNPGGNTFCRETADQSDCVDDTATLPNDGHTVNANIFRTYCINGECAWDNVIVTDSDTMEIPNSKFNKTIPCPTG